MHERDPLFKSRIATDGKVHADSHDSLRIEAAVDLQKIDQTMQQETRGSQTQSTQCHLRADKHKTEPAGSTASRQSRSACHGFASVSLAKLPGGRHADDQACDGGNDQRKHDGARVDVHLV